MTRTYIVRLPAGLRYLSGPLPPLLPPTHTLPPLCVRTQVVRSPLSVEAGTLTRTMKPRRPLIRSVYSQEVEQLMARLRG